MSNEKKEDQERPVNEEILTDDELGEVAGGNAIIIMAVCLDCGKSYIAHSTICPKCGSSNTKIDIPRMR